MIRPLGGRYGIIPFADCFDDFVNIIVFDYPLGEIGNVRGQFIEKDNAFGSWGFEFAIVGKGNDTVQKIIRQTKIVYN